MGFKCGIVGLPNVGKSTLFNALTASKNAEAANFPFCTIDPNIGIVDVTDRRLDQLSKLSNSKKNNLVSFGYDFLKDLYSKGIIQINYNSSNQSYGKILLKSSVVAEKRNVVDFYTVNTAANQINLITKLSDSEYKFLAWCG